MIWRWLGWAFLSEAVVSISLVASLFIPNYYPLLITMLLVLPAMVFFAVWWLHLVFVLVIEDSGVMPDPPPGRSLKERAHLAGGLLMSLGVAAWPFWLTWLSIYR